MIRVRLLSAILAGLAATGCASSVYEGKYAWVDGWRKATVVRVGPASELGGRHTYDCRFTLKPEQFSPSDSFVVVSFADPSRQRRAVIRLAATAPDPMPGELVYANVRCDKAPLESRSEQRPG